MKPIPILGQPPISLFASTVALATLFASAAAFCRAQHHQTIKTPLRTIKFDTDEGTTMCVDVSPDGKTLVFDLLGDLYTLPITGGQARPLLTGRPWDRCPRFSPDGRQVSFLSDRIGVTGIWVLDLARHRVGQLNHVRAEGAGPIREATGTPEWLPGGRELSFGVLGANGIGLSAVSTSGGVPRLLVPGWKPPPDESVTKAYSATFTPDGKTAFFSAWYKHLTGNPVDDADPSGNQIVLYSMNLVSQQATRLTASDLNRAEIKPQISRSGRYLAYARRDGLRDIELRVRDLQNSDDKRLTTLIDAVDPFTVIGGALLNDPIPAYAFTPDDRFIVIWYGGRIHKVAVADGSSSIIPFKVHVVREVAEPIHAHYRIPDDPLKVRAIRWPTVSPDRKTLVFSAVGSLWASDLPQGAPRRLTQGDDFEFMPVFSPDGHSIAYVTFGHTADSILAPGRLMILRLDNGTIRHVATDNASYYIPAWSPDGTKLAVVRETGTKRDAKADFGWVDVASGSFHPIATAYPYIKGDDPRGVLGQHIVFTQDGSQLIYQPGTTGGVRNTRPVIHIVRLDGSGDHTLAIGDSDVLGIFLSPGLSKILYVGRDLQAYVGETPTFGQKPLSISMDNSAAVPSGTRNLTGTRISTEGALFPSWVDDQTAVFGWTNQIFEYHANQTGSTLIERVDLKVPRRGGKGVTAFRNARLITVNGVRGAGPVIEHGTLIVRDTRISKVGRTERVAIPAGATVIDATGWTIMPGLIESHDHGLARSDGRTSPVAIPIGTSTTLRAAIPYGVTTAWEASGPSDDGSLSQTELLEAGRILGQRWFAAGGIMSSTVFDYRNPDDMQAVVRTKVMLGGEQCLKNYGSPDRTISGWFAEAARGAGVCVAVHTTNPVMLLSRAADGYAVEHPSLTAPSYRDVVQFMARTRAIWTANVQIFSSYRSNYSVRDPNDPNGLYRIDTMPRSIVEEMGLLDDQKQMQKLERLVPTTAQELKIPTFVPYEQTPTARVARVAAAIASAGGNITASVDGRGPFANHLELWALHHGGMPVGDVIRAATITGAEKLGIQDDVGSLAPGKLADFVVLTANPLERIENTLKLKYTVLAGIIYDSDSLEVVSPQKAGEEYEFEEALNSYVHEALNSAVANESRTRRLQCAMTTDPDRLLASRSL